MSAAAASAVEVFVFQAGRFLGSRCFTQSTIVIGSGPEATLRLRDPSIAARHAVLRVKGDALVLANNGEAGGQVLINGEPISVRQVHSFDEIRVGPFRLKLTLLGDQAEEDPGFGASPPAPAEPASAPGARQRRPAPAAEPQRDPTTGNWNAQPRSRDAQMAAAWAEDPEDAPTRQHIPAWDGDPGHGDGLGGSDFDDDSVTRLRHRPAGADGRGRAPSSQFDATSALARSAAETGRSAADPLSDGALSRQAEAPTPRRAAPAPSAASQQRTQPFEQPYPADLPPETLDGPQGSGHGGQQLDPQTEPQPAWPSEPERPASSSDPYGATARAPSVAPSEPLGDFEDDEDEDDAFVETFSLLENIVRERFKANTETEHHSVVEVIRYRNGEILDLMRASRGQTVRLEPDGFKLLRVTGDGVADLFFRPDSSGSVVRGGKARPLKRLALPDTIVDTRKQLHAIQLREGDYAQIVRDEAGYLARFVKPPTVPNPKQRFRLDLSQVQVFAGSAAFHFLILVLLGFVAPEADLNVESEAERFAKVSVKDLQLEKPKEEPKKEEPPPEPPPEQPKDSPKPKKRVKSRRPVSAARRAQAQQRQQKKQVSNVLTALQNIAPSGKPGRSNLKSLVTNVKAVRAPSGVGSSFKIAGTIGKIAGKGIRLAGGGGGGKETKVGSKLLAGGKIGSIKALAGTGTRVRGRARKAPTRKIGTTGGILSREAIQKVVSRHMHKIQACYERQLLVNRGLSGKIVFDWVISPSGSVGSARQARSTLASAAVSSCILSEIKRWRFPKPVGGSVQVRYPFVFRVQGF